MNITELKSIISLADSFNTASLRSFLLGNPSKPLILVGSGGMTGTGECMATVYTSLSGLARAMTPLEMNSLSDRTLSSVKILLLSKGGHNADIEFAAKRALRVNPSQTACMCLHGGEKNVIKPLFEKAGLAANCFIYESKVHDGFVSCGSPVMYLALLCKALGVLSQVDTEAPASVTFCTNGGQPLGPQDFSSLEHFTLLSAGWGQGVSSLLEGKLVESGWASGQMYDYRNYCHGRFIFTSNHLGSSAVVMLVTPNEKALAARIRSFLPQDTKLIIIETALDSPAASLDLLLSTTLTFHSLAEAAGFNPESPKNPGRIDKRKPIWVPFAADLKKAGPLTL